MVNPATTAAKKSICGHPWATSNPGNKVTQWCFPFFHHSWLEDPFLKAMRFTIDWIEFPNVEQRFYTALKGFMGAFDPFRVLDDHFGEVIV